MLKALFRNLFTSVAKPRPLGRWAIGGDWETRARLASQDSCCCTYLHKRECIVVGDDVVIIWHTG